MEGGQTCLTKTQLATHPIYSEGRRCRCRVAGAYSSSHAGCPPHAPQLTHTDCCSLLPSQHATHLGQRFQVAPSLHQDAQLCCSGHGADHSHGGGDDQGAGAGGDQDLKRQVDPPLHQEASSLMGKPSQGIAAGPYRSEGIIGIRRGTE